MRVFSLPYSHLSFQKSTREVMEMGALRIKSSNLLKSSKLHHTYYNITLLNIATVVQVCWVLIKNKHPHHQAWSSTTRKRTTTRTNKPNNRNNQRSYWQPEQEEGRKKRKKEVALLLVAWLGRGWFVGWFVVADTKDFIIQQSQQSNKQIKGGSPK
jgi:hypothetical protein